MTRTTVRIIILVAIILTVSICLIGCNNKPIPIQNVLISPELSNGNYTGKVISSRYKPTSFNYSGGFIIPGEGQILLDIGKEDLITIELNDDDDIYTLDSLFGLAKAGMFLHFTVKNGDIPENDWKWVSTIPSQ